MIRNERITLENIDSVEYFLMERSEYFGKWRVRQLERKENPDDFNYPYVETFLSKETYLNYRVGICGFIGMCRYLLEKKMVEYVPVLFNNSSVVESLFAAIRNTKMDFSSMYATAICTLNLEKASSCLKKGGCYSMDSVGEIKTVHHDLTISKLTRENEARIEHVKNFGNYSPIYLHFPRRCPSFDSEETMELVDRMKCDFATTSIARKVFESTYYLSFVRLSLNTPSKDDFLAVKYSSSLSMSSMETFMWEIMMKCVEYSQDMSTSKIPANVLSFNAKLMKFR